MPTLYPPEYPARPDAPLAAFGLSFSQELARSVIATVWHRGDDGPGDRTVRVAAALTMLEAFHPRDHLECMLAAAGVAAHASVMECLARSFAPGVEDAVGIKLRANAAQVYRMFSTIVHDLEKRQSKPLPARPEPPPPPAAEPSPPPPPPSGRAPGEEATSEPAAPAEAMPPENPTAVAPPAEDLAAALEADARTRPDGTPGSLDAYTLKIPEQAYVPREPAIMRALATRPKPWRQVNLPKDPAQLEPAPDLGPGTPVPEPEPFPGNVVRFREKYHEGDALARFASTRFDPDAPMPTLSFEDDAAEIELEVIDTGGDPEIEAHAAALAAAHPEGRPVSIRRYGARKPPDDSG